MKNIFLLYMFGFLVLIRKTSVLAGKRGHSASSEPRSWTRGFINISQMIMFFLGDEERCFMVRYENKNAK